MTGAPWIDDQARLVGALAAAIAAAVIAAALLRRWMYAPRRPDPPGAEGPTGRPQRSGTARRRPGHRSDAQTNGSRWRRSSLGAARRLAPSDPAVVAAWLDDVARATRVGHSLPDAIATAPSPALEARLAPLRQRLSVGDTVAGAVEGWRDRLPPADESLLTSAAVFLVADEVGGSMATPIERAAALLRARAAEADERAGWAAQAQLSARVLATMPIALLAVLVVVDRDVFDVLRSPLGLILLGAGLTLDLFGFVWMRRIVAGNAA